MRNKDCRHVPQQASVRQSTADDTAAGAKVGEGRTELPVTREEFKDGVPIFDKSRNKIIKMLQLLRQILLICRSF